jgi:erythromycin esterase
VSARVPAAVQAWVRSQAIALRSTRPGSGWDDLEPLRDVLERARVVALGEATHGTREFFRLKQRLVEYLVSALGFNVFALEADFGAALAVDDYVQGGPGTAEQALARLDFWTWNAAELRDLIVWMRAWNTGRPGRSRLCFRGVDLQLPRESAGRLATWLAQHDPGALPWLAALAPLWDAAADPGPQRARAALDALAVRMAKARTRDAVWRLARRTLDVLGQAWVLRQGGGRAWRERALAGNARWLLRDAGPTGRLVLWAHNGHVAAEPYGAGLPTPMGAYLKQALGDRLATVGFAFNRGSFRARDRAADQAVVSHVVEPLPPGAFDRALAEAGPPLFALALDSARGAARSWLAGPLPHRAVGASYDRRAPHDYVRRIRPARCFDAVVVVERSTPSSGLDAATGSV